jgi:DNA primase
VRTTQYDVYDKLKVLIRDYLDYEGVEKSNGKYRCINPTHKDDIPSMKVYEDHAYCFGCNTYFDTIKAYMTIHNTDRVTAIRSLCEIFKLKEPVAKSDVLEAKHVMLTAFNALKPVRYSPDTVMYLKSKGISLPAARSYGVLQFSKPALMDVVARYPHMSNLLGLDALDTDGFLYTVYDIDGMPIAFVARNFKIQPKFKNPKNNIIYNKSAELYGQHILASSAVVIVEGYSDALSAWANGKMNVVALGGTRINENTVTRLKSLGVDKVALCLDGDDTGMECMLDGMKKMLDAGFHTYGAVLEYGADPDDYFKSGVKLPVEPAYMVAWKLTRDIDKTMEYIELDESESAVETLAELSGMSTQEIALRIANELYSRARPLRTMLNNALAAQEQLKRYREVLRSVGKKADIQAIMDFDTGRNLDI